MALSPNKSPNRWFSFAGPPGCWEWTGAKTTSGYGKLHDGSNRRAHRAIFEALNGKLDAGMIVMHICNNPICVRPDHLRAGTHRDNTQDKWSKGRGKIREGQAKITKQDAEDIRRVYATGTVFQKDLAAKYGLSQTAISRVIHNRSWK